MMNLEREIMIQIIETNISYDEYGRVQDFQSRVIKYESWEVFVKLFENYKGKSCGYCEGTMVGNILPKLAKINSLEYDDFHLVCNLGLLNCTRQKKYAYLISSNLNTEV